MTPSSKNIRDVGNSGLEILRGKRTRAILIAAIKSRVSGRSHRNSAKPLDLIQGSVTTGK
ncbi:hypothetical protein [Scytonema hofmannii]|uniref:hypothetical protein n=1 Tax=Scytonema hofmannii TaxID=34078 RepID=UPI001313E145|nr:hypothetical protein [Scytonema hofmannii]